MNMTTTLDVVERLFTGQWLGARKRDLLPAYLRALRDAVTAADVAATATGNRGLSNDADTRRTAWTALLEATGPAAGLTDLLAQVVGLTPQAETAKAGVIEAVKQVIDLTKRDVPDALVPPELRAPLAAVRANPPRPERAAKTMLGLDVTLPVTDSARSIGALTRLRLRALNALVLSDIAAATPNNAILDAAGVARVAKEADRRTDALLAATRRAATELGTRGVSVGWSAEAWAAIYAFETWLVSEGAERVASAAAAATKRAGSGVDNAERVAREVATAVDAVRHGLAYDAGLRAILLAAAVQDVRALAAIAAAAKRRLRTATADYARSTVGAVARARRGQAVEIAGMVTAVEVRVAPNNNRSVMTLGEDALRVLVPHIAVNSFGVDAGVWVQVRGTAYPAGKDGIEGPVVMMGRIARTTAAAKSFTDALIVLGREAFDLRPGQLDLVAGRVAGSNVTLNELGMRR